MTAAQERPAAGAEYRLRRTATGFVIYDPDRALLGEGATVDAAHAAIEQRLLQWRQEADRAGLSPAVRRLAASDSEWRRFGFFALRVAVVAAAVLFVLPSPAGIWRMMPPPEIVGRVLLERLHQTAEGARQAKPETTGAILADVRALARALTPFVVELRAAYDAAEPARGDAKR